MALIFCLGFSLVRVQGQFGFIQEVRTALKLIRFVSMFALEA